MRLLIAALFASALIWAVPTETPVNKVVSSTKVQAVRANLPEKEIQDNSQEKALMEPQATTTGVVSSQEEKPASTPQTPVENSTEIEAKAFIYHHESTTNPAAENSLGCYGLGQDCNGIVKDRCGADYQCQDDFFTDYMLRRYGSWQAAKSFWLSRVPINGQDVGNWW